MLDRNHLETLLRIHGLGQTSPLDEIRSILYGAQYNPDEVESAIELLQKNVVVAKTKTEGLHKIYRTDDSLASREVSALLGVDMDISETEIRNHRQRGLTGGQNFIVLAMAILFALSAVLYAMYEHQSGPFHPSRHLVNR